MTEKAPEQIALEKRLRELFSDVATLDHVAEPKSEEVVEALGERLLLLKHLPLLRYDAQDPWRADSIATMTDNPGNALARSDGTVIAQGPGLNLHVLTHYPAGFQPEPGDMLRQAPDSLGSANRLVAELVRTRHGPIASLFDPPPDAGAVRRYADRTYGRVVRDGGRTWLQYWFWFYYTPNNLLGFGRRAGDWKLLQVGLDGHGIPEVATFSRRGNRPETRRWADIEVHARGDTEGPIAYISPISHGFYFESGHHWSDEGPDSAFGNGAQVIPTLEPFGPWVHWPGRWGETRGLFGGRLRGYGSSPRGPAFHPAWNQPSRFMGGSPRLERVSRFLTMLTCPSPPGLGGEMLEAAEGTRVRLECKVRASGLRRPSRLYITVHTDDDDMQVLFMLAPRVRDVRGPIELVMPQKMDRCVIVASALTSLRVRSDPATLRLP